MLMSLAGIALIHSGANLGGLDVSVDNNRADLVSKIGRGEVAADQIQSLLLISLEAEAKQREYERRLGAFVQNIGKSTLIVSAWLLIGGVWAVRRRPEE